MMVRLVRPGSRGPPAFDDQRHVNRVSPARRLDGMNDETTIFMPCRPRRSRSRRSRLSQAIRQIGPGLILAASIVGTGELINTTSLGAKAGFSLLWLILLSA